MKKLGRVVLFVIGAIAAMAAVILLAVNLYVQSQGTQARIQQELRERLGTNLRVRRISVTPWGGLKLTGITIPQVAGAPGEEFLDAKTFRLRIRFASLFSQRLVIKEISLIGPTVVWLQNPEGKWRLPEWPNESVTKAAASAAPPPVDVAPPPEPRQAVASPPPSPQQPANVNNTESAVSESGFVPEIQRVNLVGGHFRFLDQHAKVVAIFDDVQFHSNFRDAADVRGAVGIGKTSLRDRFFLHDLQSRLSYGPTALEFSDISATAAGGRINGKFTMQPQAPDSPFTATIKFQDVQADKVVTEAGGPAGTISGKLEGNLDASGRTADPNALAGAGEIVLRDGQLRQYSLLDALGQLLQIDELRQLRLDDAHVKYHITPGVVIVDELLLRSANIRWTATGTVGFDGKLQLGSQLAINDKIRKQLFRGIRENFQPIAEPGFAAVSFDIGGTVDRPKSDLMNKLVGGDLKEIGSVINALMGGKSDRPKKKKNANAPASETAQPAESPTTAETPQPTATP